ncbi:MAG: DNA-3-methyladenine glycosylase family protein [Blautia sp.]|uniref:DNA-3-methyladenine glycosylase family protein n=1 Tax=Blautia sp. TaxID=1955243 RepID=UPI002E78289F|nr:DNA glycosylase [Blautia sp.]MED9881409.1 DNA glycosylase [Blautia sp.]
MVTMELDNFSLEQICDSGQCFRMKKIGEHTYSLVAGDQYLEITQKGTIVDFHCSDVELICFWVPYFDLDTDYSEYIQKVNPRDRYLSAAAEMGSGIRILRQDLWEMIITFLISQQNHITRIRGCIERLCACYGDKKVSREGVEYYSFPGPEALALATETELRELGMGYRARYLVETARSIAEGEVSLEKIFQMRYYSRAKKELMRLSGVGEKVADCICLFALHHMDAFPVDTHIRQVLEIHYKRGFPNRRYHGMRGIMQQYIFYYELMKGRK